MNDPYASPYNDPLKKSSSPLILIIAVDLMILGGAIGFYFWQESLWISEKTKLQRQVSELQIQVKQLELEKLEGTLMEEIETDAVKEESLEEALIIEEF